MSGIDQTGQPCKIPTKDTFVLYGCSDIIFYVKELVND